MYRHLKQNTRSMAKKTVMNEMHFGGAGAYQRGFNNSRTTPISKNMSTQFLGKEVAHEAIVNTILTRAFNKSDRTEMMNGLELFFGEQTEMVNVLNYATKQIINNPKLYREERIHLLGVIEKRSLLSKTDQKELKETIKRLEKARI